MQYNIIDVTSEQYKQDVQRVQTLRTQIVIWLIIIALGVALIPLAIITSWIRTDVARLETDLLSLQSAVSSAITPSEEVVKINTEIAGVETLIGNILTVTISSGVNWPRVMDPIEQFDATAIEITSLTQTPDKIQLAGRATSNDAVVRFQQQLLDSGAYKDVVVISMSTVPPPPTPAPPAEAKNKNESPPVPVEPVEVEEPFGEVEFLIDIIVAAINMGNVNAGIATP